MADVHNGRCLCGAIEMQGLGEASVASCHCEMCQRWHGGPSLSANFVDGIQITKGEDNVGWYKSSDWAERGFCKTCGSTLFYRLLDGGMIMGESGSFDMPKGLKITEHYFIDEKPDYYDIADDAPQLTGAEVFAKYAPDAEEAPQ